MPILRADWIRTEWAFMRLRNRALSPATIALMVALREANADALAQERKLEKRWRALLPPAATPAAATEATGVKGRPVRRAR